MRRLLAIMVVTSAIAAGCGGGDGGDDGDASGVGPSETPTFSGTATDVQRSDGSSDTAPTTASTGGPADATTTTTKRVQMVSFDDPVGDATPGVGAGQPPAWTDLAGGSLERQGNAYRLTVRLASEAPQTAPGPETMNIATYFDIDGDDGVEYELWVNLGRSGWFPVWYDDKGNAIRGDDTNVTVVVEGDEVRLLFPDVMIDEPEQLRFSIASEYGPLTSIGSSTARRDDAPDGDRAVAFPWRQTRTRGP